MVDSLVNIQPHQIMIIFLLTRNGLILLVEAAIHSSQCIKILIASSMYAQPSALQFGVDKMVHSCEQLFDVSAMFSAITVELCGVF